MSKALKCDRCKACFDPSESKGEFMTFGDIFFQDGTNYKNHEVSYREDDPTHLCPKCTLDFTNWFCYLGMPVEERCPSSANYTKTQTPMKFSDFQKNDLPPSASCASSKAEDAAKQKNSIMENDFPPSASCASSKAEDAAKQKNILMENIIAEIDTMASNVVCQFLDLAESIKTHVDSQK